MGYVKDLKTGLWLDPESLKLTYTVYCVVHIAEIKIMFIFIIHVAVIIHRYGKDIQ